MPLMRLIAAVALLGACAQAGKQDNNFNRGDGGIALHDSSGPPPPDAFVNPIDAPPGVMTKTLDENTNDMIAIPTSIACSDNINGVPQYTNASSYYRVFDPANYQITTDFHVTQVGFQVENSTQNAGNGILVTVKVGTYDAVPATQLDTTKMAVLATQTNVQTPENDEVGAAINQPITATIPAGKRLFVEVDSPQGSSNDNLLFYIGANAVAESSPGYVMSSACTETQKPTNISSLGAGQISILMTVTGTY